MSLNLDSVNVFKPQIFLAIYTAHYFMNKNVPSRCICPMYRLGGIICYEVNTYLQYVICNEDGVVSIPSATLVSVYTWD